MTSILTPSCNQAAVLDATMRCGAAFADDPHGPQALFDMPSDAVSGRLALLPDWGVLSVSGADALTFLQGQTTNDILGQAEDEMRFNGYCTPKGRLLATGPLWRENQSLRQAVSRPLARALGKRLSIFVLRAKAGIEDISDTVAILGLTGEPAAGALRELGIEPPGPMRVACGADPTMRAIGFVPVSGIGPRWWLTVSIESLADTWARLAARLSPVPSSWWRAGEILAGEPRIVAATSEMFVPQTVNWELVGGVSFRKGCYPGQEVVARLHYRGKPRRRSFIARLSGDAGPLPAPGSDLLRPGANEPAGTVVASAPAPDGGLVLMHEAPIEVALREGLRTPDGRLLEPLALPYSLPPTAAPEPAGGARQAGSATSVEGDSR